MKFDDAYFRIQDSRFKLPKASKSYWTSSDADYMNGVSAFSGLFQATRDLLGRESVDGWGTCYADEIENDGGKPTLSIFSGEFVEEDGHGVVVKPDRHSEKRFAPTKVWEAWLKALIGYFPEDKQKLKEWERTPSGFDDLKHEYQLSDFEEEAFISLMKR